METPSFLQKAAKKAREMCFTLIRNQQVVGLSPMGGSH